MDAVEQEAAAREALARSLSLSMRSQDDDWYKPTLTRANALAARMYREIFGGRIPADTRAAITEYVEKALRDTKRNPDGQDAQVARLSRGLASYLASAVLDSNTPSAQWEKVWRTVHDDKVRDSHAMADGQVVDGDGYFTVGGVKMFAPGDLSAPAEEWAGCRCHPEYRRRTALPDQLVAAADIDPGGFVIVGLPAADDPIYEVSSEQPPHLTMIYLSVDFIEQAAQILAGEAPKCEPTTVEVTETGELGDGGAQVAHVNPLGLADVREALMGYEPIQQGVEAMEQYPEWTPHVTLGYPETPPLSGDVPDTITIDRLAILDGSGALHSEYPLGEAMDDTAVEETPVEEVDEFPTSGVYEPVPLYGVLAPEGKPTGDRRGFMPNSLEWLEPPLALRWQEKDMPGHDGSVSVASMDRIWRDEATGLIKWEGMSGVSDAADRHIALIAEKIHRGVSVDLDDAQVEVRSKAGEPIEIPDDPELAAQMDFNDVGEWVTYGRIRSAASCAIPAFPEAFIAIGTWAEHDAQQDAAEQPEVDEEPGEIEAMAASAREDLTDALVAAPGTQDGPGWLTHPIDTDRLRDYWVRGKGAAKIGWGAPGDFNRCRAFLAEYIKPMYLAGYCFTGDTEFLTRDGVTTFGEAVGTTQQVLTMKEPLGPGASPVTKAGYWVDAPIESFGEQPVLSVTLRRANQRKVIKATPEHEWFASTDARSAARTKARKVTTADLRPGMALASLMPMPVAKRGTVPSPYGIAAGAVFGDGHRGPHGASIDLWGDKDAQLLRYFEGNPMSAIKTEGGVLGTRVRSLPSSWKGAPSLDEGPSYLLGWLAGYIAADGHVTKRGAISLSSSNRDHLVLAQTVANRLGVSTLPITHHMRTGKGTEPTPLFKLPFVGETFPEAALVIAEHRSRLVAAAPKFTATRWVVESVEDRGEAEEVFCAVVPETETFALADYVWVHNCANRHKDALGFWPGEHRPGKASAKVATFNLVASAGTLKPPREWFENPNFTERAPMTITEPDPHTGLRRVFGHAAEWDECHTGFADRCVSPPSSPSDYSRFHLGHVVLDDGTKLPTGTLTMDTGHAALSLSASSAAAHYDNTGTSFAQVRCGEDGIGIWFAGVIEPKITDEQVFSIRGAKISGDWRNVAGQGLDAIAMLAVNTPGFPIVHAALAASAGERQALVAAGIVEDEPVTADTLKRIVAAAVDERLEIISARQSLVAAARARRREAMDAIAASAASRKDT